MRSWAQHVAPALILPPVLPPLERLVAVPRVDDLAPLLLQWRRLGAREARNLVRDPINDGGWQLLRVKNRVISRETRHTLQMRAPVMGLQRSLAQKRSRRHQDSVAAKAGIGGAPFCYHAGRSDEREVTRRFCSWKMRSSSPKSSAAPRAGARPAPPPGAERPSCARMSRCQPRTKFRFCATSFGTRRFETEPTCLGVGSRGGGGG